jgi:hypothetical protein
MIFLHVECAYRPGVRFADSTDFLFDKCRKLAHQNLFPVLRTPDKVIGQLIRDVFGVLCLHTLIATDSPDFRRACSGRLTPR